MSVSENELVIHRYMKEIVNETDKGVRDKAIDRLIAPDFVSHSRSDEAAPSGREGLRNLIGKTRTKFPDLRYHYAIRDDTNESKGNVQIDWTGYVTIEGHLNQWRGTSAYRFDNGQIAVHWWRREDSRPAPEPIVTPQP